MVAESNEKHQNIEERERDFHDGWARTINPADVPVLETFTASTSPEPQWLLAQMGDIRNKRLLDLGSGAGEAAVYFARMGAKVTATDLSPKMLGIILRVAELHRVTVETCVCSAEDLSQFPDGSFDIVYAANLLHHVDIEKCLDEVSRVLRPGGIGAFWDPVAHNPAINVYRRMAIGVRTEDEHPIRRSQLSWFKSRFACTKIRFFWFTTLLVFVKFYLIDGIHPSSDRYWKRILTHETSLRWLYRPLAVLDRIILTIFPILGWWCWNIGVIVYKGKN